MRHFLCRADRLSRRLAVFVLALLLTSGLVQTGAASESEDGARITAVRASVELFLRNYTEEAMLYEPRDQRLGTVSDPNIVLSPEAEAQTFRIGRKDVTLAQMRENIAFAEKKADYYAGMRQMQNIYRENLELAYTYQKMDFTDNVCQVKVTEASGFRYTDSVRPTINETIYWLDLVELDGRWLVGDVTDGSRFDITYRKQGSAFDPDAALERFRGALAYEDCQVSFPNDGSGGWDVVTYNGANAAAYAYTYSRLTPQAQKPEYYNPLFINYAGNGGDCMNFASQCMWAGFGGSETAEVVSGHAQPMDISGEGQWYGRSAEGEKINHSWISCQSFREYLTGKKDGTGTSGSNIGWEAGMYATVLDVGAGSCLAGVDPWELVGAAAHIDSGSGTYGHAIVITAAEGLRRSEIYYCGHTKNVTHVKLGDVFSGSLKVYIPRYFRTGKPQGSVLQPIRPLPEAAGTSSYIGVWTIEPMAKLVIEVTSPTGEKVEAAAASGTNICVAEYIFPLAGTYRVECRGETVSGEAAEPIVYHVRCY